MNTEDIQTFLANPGESWAKAYAQLSESEKTLLLSVLDAGATPTKTEVQAVYERRIFANA